MRLNYKKMKKLEKEYTTMKVKEKEDEIELRVSTYLELVNALDIGCMVHGFVQLKMTIYPASSVQRKFSQFSNKFGEWNVYDNLILSSAPPDRESPPPSTGRPLGAGIERLGRPPHPRAGHARRGRRDDVCHQARVGGHQTARSRHERAARASEGEVRSTCLTFEVLIKYLVFTLDDSNVHGSPDNMTPLGISKSVILNDCYIIRGALY